MRFIKPKLITFDINGTLLMTDMIKHYTAVGLEHGISVDEKKLSNSFKENFRKISNDQPLFGKYTGLGSDNWWRLVVYGVFREQNPKISEEKLSKVATSLIEVYKTKICWYPLPGAIELLEFLHKQKIVLGVISNFDERLDTILESMNMKRYFSFILCSYHLGIEKPNPAIFNEGLKMFIKNTRLNILPEEALHIGDRVDNDYEGAKSANWNAFLIKPDSETDALVAKSDIFGNLEEVKKHFERELRI